MKIKSNFTLGLILGIGLSAVLTLFMSSTTRISQPNATADMVDPVKGGFTSIDSVKPLINAYKTDWVEANRLPDSTSIGGYIGKQNLAMLVGMSSSENIKFRFYYTSQDNPEQGSVTPQIGLVLFPDDNAPQVLRTGSGSFCPSLCNMPD